MKYFVFLAIHKRYRINPFWLATGEGPQGFEYAMDFGRAPGFLLLKPGIRFSEAYDRHIVHHGEVHERLARQFLIRILNQSEIPRSPNSRCCTSDVLHHVRRLLEELNQFFSPQFLGLTDSSEFRKTTPMKPLALNELLEMTRQVVEPAGAKAALAKYLGVPQSRVSEWLGGKYSPSGEIVLRLLAWVSDPALQQKTLGSVTSTAKGKSTPKKGKINEINQSQSQNKQ